MKYLDKSLEVQYLEWGRWQSLSAQLCLYILGSSVFSSGPHTLRKTSKTGTWFREATRMGRYAESISCTTNLLMWTGSKTFLWVTLCWELGTPIGAAPGHGPWSELGKNWVSSYPWRAILDQKDGTCGIPLNLGKILLLEFLASQVALVVTHLPMQETLETEG